jgi:outer membrane protein OmpA-like peptidoglycan-associated protein
MRSSVVVMFLGAALGAQALAAEEPVAPQSSSEYVKAIEALKAGGAPAPVGADGCAPGLVENEDGDCGRPVKGRGADLAGNISSSSGPRSGRLHGASARRAGTVGPTPVNYAEPPAKSVLGSLPITFKLGSADITPASKSQVHLLALALLSPEEIHTRFLIAGHTDASGSLERNRILSLARADSVKTYLVEQGVDPSRLEVKGYGAEGLARPEAPLDPANRRVEARPVP